MKNKKTLIVGAETAGREALATIQSLKNQGCDVVCVPENQNNMKKSELYGLFALAMMGESMLHSQPERLRAEEIDLKHGSLIQKEKRIPKGCKKFIIGKYEVIAINRKNAVRKALKQRKREFNCL